WWPLQPHPCALEPIWEPYNRHALTMWDCLVNGWEGAWEGSWFKRTFFSDEPVLSARQPVVLPASEYPDLSTLRAVVVEQFADDETTIPCAEQFLRAIRLDQPAAFEIFGLGSHLDHTQAHDIRKRGKNSDATGSWTKPYTVTRFV